MTRLDLRQTLGRKKDAARRTICLVLLLCCGSLFTAAQAQTPDAGPTLGQITGQDVSVIGPSQAAPNSPVPAIDFSGGSTIVVHSGKARIDFVGGGVLDICGPAKFTVLSSGEALTIALSFGRVRLRVDALRPIAIYSPLVLATPVPMGDRSRDATIGLTNNGAMCVLASSGAVRLQNQLSGETVIVPQPAEVLVPGASFAYLPRAAGQCRCEFDESSPRQSASATPSSAQPPVPASPPPAKHPAPPSLTPNSASSVGQAATPQPQLPISPAVPKNLPASLPPSSPSLAAPTITTAAPLKINLPPIGYDASGATETAEPLSVATLLLAQQVVVRPEWTFHGMVGASGNESNSASSVDQSAAASSSQSSPNQPKQKKGFWAKLRAFITGSH